MKSYLFHINGNIDLKFSCSVNSYINNNNRTARNNYLYINQYNCDSCVNLFVFIGQPTGSGNSPLNSILPPTTVDDFSTSSASPLQRMASITNSLISQPSTPSHHSPSQRPLKAVLPPITQQQFDQFNNLNTEDIVKKVM